MLYSLLAIRPSFTGDAHEDHRRQDLGCRQPAARHRRPLFHLRQADHRWRRGRLWRGLQCDVRASRDGADDRGHGRALSARPRPARHRDLLPPRLFVGLHAAPGRFGDGLLLGAGDRLLGHHRQGGRQAGLQAARRPGARDAALLHLSLPAQRQRLYATRFPTAMSTTIPISRPNAPAATSSRVSTRSSSIRPVHIPPSTGTSRG